MSSLSNSPSKQLLIRLEQAKSFSFETFFFVDENDTAADLTGCQLSLVIRKPAYQGGTIVLTKAAVLVDAAAGYARFDLQASETDQTPGSYPYTLSLLTAQGYSAVVAKGDVEILENTEDAWVGEVYAGVLAPTSLSVVLQKNNTFKVTIGHIPPNAGEIPPTIDAATITAGTVAIARLPVADNLESNANEVVRSNDGRLSDARTPTAHVHAAADVSSGTLAIARLPVADDLEVSATEVVRANDGRLSNARTPTAHAHAAADVTSGILDIARLPVADDLESNANEVVRSNDTRVNQPQGAWTTFTPAWTSSGTAPAIGNGQLLGRYKQVGKTVHVEYYWQAGSTTTFGTGNYSLSLPVTAANAIGGGNVAHGVFWFRDISVPADFMGFAVFAGTGTIQIRGLSANALWSATTPATPANGDWVSGSFTYEAA